MRMGLELDSCSSSEAVTGQFAMSTPFVTFRSESRVASSVFRMWWRPQCYHSLAVAEATAMAKRWPFFLAKDTSVLTIVIGDSTTLLHSEVAKLAQQAGALVGCVSCMVLSARKWAVVCPPTAWVCTRRVCDDLPQVPWYLRGKLQSKVTMQSQTVLACFARNCSQMSGCHIRCRARRPSRNPSRWNFIFYKVKLKQQAGSFQQLGHLPADSLDRDSRGSESNTPYADVYAWTVPFMEDGGLRRSGTSQSADNPSRQGVDTINDIGQYVTANWV